MHDDEQISCAKASCKAHKCSHCEAVFPSLKAMEQRARIAHKIRSLPAMCVLDISTCSICHTDFNRIALIAHLGDTRVRSRIRNICCAPEYRKTDPPPLPAEEFVRLNDIARLARKRAFDQGHSHVIQQAPAKRPRRVDCGIPAVVLKLVQAGGVRRRLACKTKPNIANLGFKPRSYCNTSNMTRKRISQKSSFACGFAPRYRLRTKTKVSELVRQLGQNVQ